MNENINNPLGLDKKLYTVEEFAFEIRNIFGADDNVSDIFLAEIFPIRTTGSFFTTGNASFFFLVMAIIIALSKKEN